MGVLVGNGGEGWWGGGGGGLKTSTVFNQWSTGEMVSTDCDQRLLASEIGSDHSLIKVWRII